jgi:hypothetical protein
VLYFKSLRIRQWPLPLGAISAVAGVPMGLYDAIAASHWSELVGFVFFLASWVGIGAFVSVLFHERAERERLIGELHKAKDDLEQYAIQAEELAALRERARHHHERPATLRPLWHHRHARASRGAGRDAAHFGRAEGWDGGGGKRAGN